MRWIGADLHKHYAYVAELSADGTRHEYRVSIPSGLGEFCARLTPTDQVVVEASTSSFRFGEMVARHAGRVVVSESAQTRGAVSRPAMNDQKAADCLARLLRSEFVKPVWTPSADLRSLRCQVEHYQGLDRLRSQAIVRIRSLFQQEMTDYQPGPHIGPQAHSRLNDQFTEQPGYRLYLCSLLRQLILFNAEMAEIELSLGSWTRGSKEAALLMTIPGMGPILAAIIMSQIGDIRRFPSAEQLCSYAGLVPRIYQSGNTLRCGRISRSGRSTLRWALGVCIWSQSKYSTTLMEFKQRLAGRRPKRVANVAASRKLLAIIWSMLINGKAFRGEDAELTARKKARLERWPEPSTEALIVPKIQNPRPSQNIKKYGPAKMCTRAGQTDKKKPGVHSE